MRQYFASDYAYGLNQNVPPLIVGIGNTSTGAATSYVLYNSSSNAAPPVSEAFSPLATNAPVLLGTGSTQETRTPSAVTNLPPGQSSSVAFSTTTYAHGNGTYIASGSAGLQEALNRAAAQNGGAVIVDGRWAQLGGTTAMITAAANPTGSSVFILDLRGAALATYSWNGTAFAAGGSLSFPAGANGQSFVPFVNTENLTLSTSGLTTDTTGNLLPANSIIMAVTGTVSTAITTTTSWGLGDATTANRFSVTDSTLTLGESVPKASFPPVQIGTGVASATTGVYQAAAAKVRVTCVGSNPGAGAVRITVYGFTLVNATS